LPVSDPKALIETDKSIIVMGECMATCEKVYTSPVPLVYTRHTARFLSLWALLMPAALFSSFYSSGQSLILVPTASILALFLFGIDELALALEEPFSILPMKSFCEDFTRSAESLK
jgi:predicted membrane chloride channel (bestrophin family)